MARRAKACKRFLMSRLSAFTPAPTPQVNNSHGARNTHSSALAGSVPTSLVQGSGGTGRLEGESHVWWWLK